MTIKLNDHDMEKLRADGYVTKNNTQIKLTENAHDKHNHRQ